MSFTNYYFNYGFNTTMEKVAAKKKEDEGMSTAGKLGLGALGAGALGAGAYYGGDALSSLGDLAQEHISSPPMADAGSELNQLLMKAAPALQQAGSDWSGARDALVGEAGQYIHNAPAMLAQAKEAIKSGASDMGKSIGEGLEGAKAYGADKLDAAKQAIMEMAGKAPSASQTPGYLEHLRDKQQMLGQ